MRDKTRRWMTGAMASALCTATGAWAATSTSLPPEQTQGTVTYLTGGIGNKQASAIKHAAPKYALELEFLQNKKVPAASMTSVPISIKDHTGKVILDARSDGPFLLAKLPNGQYTITAQNAGKTETRKVNIEHGKHKTVMFDWKA